MIEIKEANERQEEQGDGNEERHEHQQDDQVQGAEQDQGLIDYLVDKIAGEEERHE